MPNADWVEATDAKLRVQAADMHATLAANPLVYGSTAGEATQFGTLVEDYDAKYVVHQDPTTRTPVARAEKATARDLLVAFMRSLGRRIQANPNVTDAQRVAIGLPVRDRQPSPTPRPATRPALSVVRVTGRNVIVRAVDETTPTRRGRPSGVAGMEIFSWVVTPGNGSEMPPADLEAWRYEGQATRGEAVVGFNAGDIGRTVILVARWFNRRGEVGAVSEPVIAVIAGAMAA